jgi:lipopolysaccharide transport system permease protein
VTIPLLTNIYTNRQLVKRLTIAELHLKYKNTYIGFIWSLLEPLAMMTILYLVFSQFVNTTGNFALFLLLGIVTWNVFAKGTSTSLVSISQKPSLVKQIYFPREILIFSSALAALVVGVLEIAVFFVIMFVLGGTIGWSALWFPVIIGILYLIVFGTSLVIGSLNAYSYDIQLIWAIILQGGFLISGIFFDITQFSGLVKTVLMANPVAQAIIVSRQALVYNTPVSLPGIAVCLVWAVVMLLIGYTVFTRLEPGFAEVV